MSEDAELLRQYAQSGSETAFAELVGRHLPLVYAAALRQGNADEALAKDVAQTVFIDLARKASSLLGREVLAGWLYTSTRLAASKAVRGEHRRQLREQIAASMQEQTTPPDSQSHQAELRLVLDEAMSELDAGERNAVLIRFFQGKELKEVGSALGISEDAARMRITRALANLQTLLKQRGVTITTVALGTALATEAATAVPAGLAAAISAAALTGSAVTTTAVIAATKAFAMTTVQKALVTVTVAVLAGAGLYEARQAASTRAEVRTLQQQQGPLTEQIQQLQRERDETARQLASLREDNERLNRDTGELRKLRGEVPRLRKALQEVGAGMQIQGRPLASWLAEVNIERGLLDSDPALDVLVAAGPAVLTNLAGILQHDPSTTQQAKAADVIGAIAHRNPAAPEIPGVISALSSAADKQDARVRRVAVQALGSVGRTASNAIPVLSRCAKDEDEWMRKCAVEALRLIGIPTSQALEALHGSLSDPDGTVQIFAVQALYELGQPPTNAVPLLIQLSKNTDVGVRCSAIQTLGRVGTNHPEAVVALKSALNDESETFVRPLAREALKKLEAKGGL